MASDNLSQKGLIGIPLPFLLALHAGVAPVGGTQCQANAYIADGTVHRFQKGALRLLAVVVDVCLSLSRRRAAWGTIRTLDARREVAHDRCLVDESAIDNVGGGGTKGGGDVDVGAAGVAGEGDGIERFAMRWANGVFVFLGGRTIVPSFSFDVAIVV